MQIYFAIAFFLAPEVFKFEKRYLVIIKSRDAARVSPRISSGAYCFNPILWKFVTLVKICMTKKLINKIVGGYKIFIWISFFILLAAICLIKYLNNNPNEVAFLNAFAAIIMSTFTAFILLLTVFIYYKILTTTEETLSFTKRQTCFNLYFDNYKLFDDLSKRNTSIVLINEIDDEFIPFFKNMTFITIHIDYNNILQNFPKAGSHNIHGTNYEIVFKRFNHKIQSFINIINDEVIKIKTDSNLTDANRTTLLELYRNFILSDYINLCKDLIRNLDWFTGNVLPPMEITNLFKCNSQNRIVFETEQFLKLYFEVEGNINSN